MRAKSFLVTQESTTAWSQSLFVKWYDVDKNFSKQRKKASPAADNISLVLIRAQPKHVYE